MEESKEKSSETRAIELRRTPTPEMLISDAIKKNASVDTIERLMVIRTQIKEEVAKEAYCQALADFQADCPIISKEKAVHDKEEKGGKLRYRFAPLDAIIKQVGTHLLAHGLSYTFKSKQSVTEYTAVCISQHLLGHSEVTEFTVPIAGEYMTAPQKVGSARTFANRYAFCNAFGILTGDEDNDAQSANGQDINIDKQIKNHVQPVKSVEYVKMENQILEDVDADIFTDKIEMDGEPYDLDKVALKLKDDLSNNYYKDGLSKVYDMIARMTLIAQERDAVNVDLINEDALSDEEIKERNLFNGTVDNVKKEGNLSE